MLFTGIKPALLLYTVPEVPHFFVSLFSLRLQQTILKGNV
jgi:hypothetical protein